MAFTIPKPIKNYGNPLPVLPSLAYQEPKEGKRLIPMEFDWAGDGSTFQVNVQGVTTQTFSQIIMLDVDNTACGADVTFYFPDTFDTLVVPASSAGLFPVFTTALSFYVSAPAALASDVSRVRVLNYRQEPIGNPPPEFTNIATVVGVNATTAVIAAGVSGTLTSFDANVTLLNGAATQTLVVALKDHATGNVIDQAAVIVLANANFFGILFSVTDTAIRFSSGIDLVITNPGFTSCQVNCSLRYHTP